MGIINFLQDEKVEARLAALRTVRDLIRGSELEFSIRRNIEKILVVLQEILVDKVRAACFSKVIIPLLKAFDYVAAVIAAIAVLKPAPRMRISAKKPLL